MISPDIDMLVSELKTGLSRRPRNTLKRSREAGILIPLLVDQDEPKFLLTRRADTMNSHRGEVAYPGGMRETQDPSIMITALREAEEEIGLSPDHVETIGQIDDLQTIQRDLIVTPTIGIIRHRPEWKMNPTEVARIFEIPLSALEQANGWRIKYRSWRGRDVPIYYFDYQGEVLWGLSGFATLLTLDLLGRRAPLDLSDYERSISRSSAQIRSNQ